jgi:cytochrome c553
MSATCDESVEIKHAESVNQTAQEPNAMKRIGLKIALVAIVASVVPAAAWDGVNVENCTWCHGTSGQGYMVAPRLAGQRPAYLISQLRDFRAHTRDNPFSRQYMWNAAAFVSPQAAHELADYFASIQPRSADDGDRALVAAGSEIYRNGIPEANIAACYACHGPNGTGIGAIPRLGGLSYSYLKARLEQWGEGYHSGIGTPMPIVARQLGPNQIAALASYLSFVK